MVWQLFHRWGDADSEDILSLVSGLFFNYFKAKDKLPTAKYQQIELRVALMLFLNKYLEKKLTALRRLDSSSQDSGKVQEKLRANFKSLYHEYLITEAVIGKSDEDQGENQAKD